MFYDFSFFFLVTAGALLFSCLCLAGTSVFAIGLNFKGHPAMFPLFLVGRLLFG